jgi:hypothetical protein
VARDYLADFLGEEESADSDSASASLPFAEPLEASGEGSPPVTARRAGGSTVEVTYDPAPCATDHTIYWGTSQGLPPEDPAWTGQACLLGDSGTASFDPGGGDPRTLVYFVVVGNDGAIEGSYGRRSDGSERPGATGLPSCEYLLVVDGVCDL